MPGTRRSNRKLAADPAVVAVLLTAAVLVALLDWSAVVRGDRRVQLVAKPLTLLLLIGVAVAQQPASADVQGWMVAALIASLAGDVALLGMSPRSFVVGLAAFLLAHIAFVVAFLLAGPALGATATAALVIVAVMALGVLVGGLGRRVVTAAQGQEPGLGAAVAAYLGVLSVMAVAGASTGNFWVVIGCTLFVASDTALGYDRFVRRLPQAPVVVIVTYHLAQLSLVLALPTLG